MAPYIYKLLIERGKEAMQQLIMLKRQTMSAIMISEKESSMRKIQYELLCKIWKNYDFDETDDQIKRMPHTSQQ